MTLALAVLECQSCGKRHKTRDWRSDLVYRCTECQGLLIAARGSSEGSQARVLPDQAPGIAPAPPSERTVVVAIRKPAVEIALVSAPAPLKAPETGLVLGDWRLERCLGQGDLGFAFRALPIEGTASRRAPHAGAVTWRLLSPDSRRDSALAERFHHAVLAAKRLAHPNICGVIEYEEHDGHAGFFRPYVEGWSLEQHLQRKGRLSVKEAVGIFKRILCAVEAAHDLDVAHGDLKACDVLLSRAGEVLVADFALPARLERPQPDEVPAASRPTFAPEVWLGMDCDRRADLYAAGALLYRMLAGRWPIEGTPRHSLSVIKQGRVTPLREACPDVPEHVARLIEALLRFDRAQRLRTAHEALEALENTVVASSKPSTRAAKSESPKPRRSFKTFETEAAKITGLPDLDRHFDPERRDADAPGLCPACEHENHSVSRFCETCGAVLFVHCPQCSSSVQVGLRFCPKCRANVPGLRLVEEYRQAAKKLLARDEFGKACTVLETVVALAGDQFGVVDLYQRAKVRHDAFEAARAEAEAAFQAGRYQECRQLTARLAKLKPKNKALKRRLHEVAGLVAEEERERQRQAVRNLVDDGADEAAISALDAFAAQHHDLNHQAFRQEVAGRLLRTHLTHATTLRAEGRIHAAFEHADMALHYLPDDAKAKSLAKSLKKELAEQELRARKRKRLVFVLETVFLLALFGGGGFAAWHYREDVLAWLRDLTHQAIRENDR